MPAFTWHALGQQLSAVRRAGYTFETMASYLGKTKPDPRTCLLRIDVDEKLSRVPRMLRVLHEEGVRGTFFFRLHAAGYNLLSHAAQPIVRSVRAARHEVGLHAEPMDVAASWGVDPVDCVCRDVRLMAELAGGTIAGAASHGDPRTGNNNLDFWREHQPAEFGLAYEAYDEQLFGAARYVSDSEWSRWKAYDHGKLLEGDRRTPGEHAREGVPLLYVLVHVDTYHDHHVDE